MTDTRHGQGFMTGLFGGALLGAVAGAFFAPQIQAACQRLRGEFSAAVTDAGDAAADAYREATTRAGSAVHDLQQEGRGVFGKVLSAVQSAADATRRSS